VDLRTITTLARYIRDVDVVLTDTTHGTTWVRSCVPGTDIPVSPATWTWGPVTAKVFADKPLVPGLALDADVYLAVETPAISVDAAFLDTEYLQDCDGNLTHPTEVAVLAADMREGVILESLDWTF
jgi:hypothetical protein